jgi:hypothetical protein
LEQPSKGVKTKWKELLEMKKIQKLISLAAVFALLAAVTVPALAADTYTYESEAKVLNDLGLYNGISDTEFDPDLGTALDRETGVVMLLRLMGLEDEALAMSDADAEATLKAKFTDAGTVANWASKYVAYATKTGLVQGAGDGTLQPKNNLTGNQYAKMILESSGYKVTGEDYKRAAQILSEKGGLTGEEAAEFKEKELIKDDLVGISFGALGAHTADGTRVIAKLVTDGVVDEGKAIGHGLMNLEVTAAVVAFEKAPITTTAEIKDARELRDTAKGKVVLLPDGKLKGDLSDRIVAHNVIVDIAEYNIINPAPSL